MVFGFMFVRAEYLNSLQSSSAQRPGTIFTRRNYELGLISADSGLQLDLEIALGGVPAKVQPHGFNFARPKMR